MKKALKCLTVFLLLLNCAHATTYYVNGTGSDASGDGSASLPWKTLKYAASKVAANQGHVIQLSSGTFIESGLIEIPLGITVVGAGKDITILKSAAGFYYHPSDPGYATDRFLISLNASSLSNGNQSLKNFTIDGDSKQLHGGIYVHNRSNVTIENVKIQNTNFTGIWLWDVSASKLKSVYLTNCSWGSTNYSSGALNVGGLQNVEVDNLQVDENTGYGIKAIGPSGNNPISSLKIHDSRISVAPTGLWNNGSAPNIAIELWSVVLNGCEIYNTYVDNTISLVNSNSPPATGVQSIRVHHNTLDMDTRSNGTGYAIELSIHDAEVDHNYFLKGTQGIANWDNAVRNWDIHHNVFYALQATYPGEMVRSQWSGLHNVKFYNNTVEFASTQTMNVIGAYGGTSEDLDIRNNLFINNNTVYSYYPNSLIHLENGATLSNLMVRNNSFDRLPIGTVTGTYSNNLTGDPKIAKSGVRPDPYYKLLTGSPLIDAGIQIGNIILPLSGLFPDIGAYEFVGANTPPIVSITSPANNTSFAAGSKISLSVSATDTDGTISKVEFYDGGTKLGEDITSPYAYSWTNAGTGSHSVTAKATDNSGAVVTSAVVIVTVNANKAPTTAITSPVANAAFPSGATITITANATDADGTISKVEFYTGSTKLGEDSTSPYSFSWANVATGNYSLTSKATDNKNAITTSAVVNISVNTNRAPTISLTSPGANATFTAGTSVTLTATAGDTDGTISKVEFFNGSTKLGEDATSPYTYTWTPVAGSYAIIAKATDDKNATATTIATTININSAAAIQLGLDSSDATLYGLMKLSTDNTADQGTYFSIPAGSGKNYYIPPQSYAEFNFTLTKTSSYVIWAKVKTPSTENQAHYIYDGKGKWLTWKAGVNTQWTWVKITDSSTGTDVSFSFNEGANKFQMAWYEDNVQVDRIIITDDLAFTPDGSSSSPALVSEPAVSPTMGIYPNPAADRFTIQYTSGSPQQAEISVFDFSSNLIKRTVVSVNVGANDIPVDTDYIYNGTYVVALALADGQRITKQLVIYR